MLFAKKSQQAVLPQEAPPQVPDYPPLEVGAQEAEAEAAFHNYMEQELRIGGESLPQIDFRLLCDYRGKGPMPSPHSLTRN